MMHPEEIKDQYYEELDGRIAAVPKSEKLLSLEEEEEEEGEAECFLFDPVIWIRRPTLRLGKSRYHVGHQYTIISKIFKINIKLSLNTNYIQ